MNSRSTNRSFHPAYFDTHFQKDEHWNEWSEEFAIITAYATTGEHWSRADNEKADLELKEELLTRCTWVRRLTGYSPVTGHAEPGWAADIEFNAACDLGRRFLQDAIYFVSGDMLWVSHCDESRRPVTVGMFQERVHTQLQIEEH